MQHYLHKTISVQNALTESMVLFFQATPTDNPLITINLLKIFYRKKKES